jgi:hypothetical protein
MKMATPTNTIKIGIVQRPKAKKAKKKYHRFLTDSLIQKNFVSLHQLPLEVSQLYGASIAGRISSPRCCYKKMPLQKNIVCTPFHGQKKFLVFWVFGFF